ncbi:hypothetical protein TSUD_354780 [Trifolium subterraneum]|uniref:Uncharacterized protein n=1 Tax=Trifolium subterraneum TaxID=3900 RepID=A0A2Z6N0N7_TRISU|nr:hypothetical protein TSUD_354780 [Trifolium subterraneum]
MYASSIRFCDQGLLQILKHEEVDDANMEVDQSEEVNMQLSPEWKVIPFQKPNRIIDTNLRVADMKMEPSEDAVEKGALVNDIDVNGSRMIEQIPYAVAESLFNR